MNSSAFWGSEIYGTPLVEIYAVSYTTSHSLEMIYCGSANHLGRFLLCYSACRSSALHFML